MQISKLIAVTLLGASLLISGANASTITNNFVFTDQSSAVVASGSFSYDSAKTGILGYSDLTAFSISLAGESYNLPFANSLFSGVDYIYFGYNVSANTFTPGLAPSIYGDLRSILAAVNTVTFESLLFSCLLRKYDVNVDTAFTISRTRSNGAALTATISPISISPAIPEPFT